MDTDIRLLELRPTFSAEVLRTPLKFGTGEVRACTSARVRARVENRAGTVADGWGQILLGVVWAFPAPGLPHERRDAAMRELTRRICRELVSAGGYRHPLDLMHEFGSHLSTLASAVAEQCCPEARMPLLAAQVCASPVDAALHDAFGRANGISAYDGYGRECMPHDLSTYLGSRFRGRFLADYINDANQPRLPVFHLVGAADKLWEMEVGQADPTDGLPKSLEGWIRRDGVFCIKVKLGGRDVRWDVERMAEVAALAQAVLASRGRKCFYLSADANELYPDPEAVVELLRRLREVTPLAFRRLLYLEQPTGRDLAAPEMDMHRAAAIKPVLADEGITDLQSLELARRLGWSGVALKTCKGHSAALLYMAKAAACGMPYSVQDLTNTGIAFLHSAGLAARIAPLKGVEYNARQYLPWSDPDVQNVHQGLFNVCNGFVLTRSLSPRGLGYRTEEIGALQAL